jgi:hypothetical protein
MLLFVIIISESEGNLMNKVSILIGKHYGDISYWAVFANRELAERQKMEFELYDALDHQEGWEYFIQDERVLNKILTNP